MNTIQTYINRAFLCICLSLTMHMFVSASSHREAPLIADDPLADNVDLYAFRSPDNPNTITIIATYVPFQVPSAGPNYYSFGENIRYEIHVDNDAANPGDEVVYRFTFNQVNEDPSTFFNIRLGLQNLKTTYTLERSIDGGQSFQVIVENGVVPPNNIGPRSIESGAGLGTDYGTLFQNAITTARTGEQVFAGPTDDPFFVDLSGVFDLGDAPRQNGTPVDDLACLNVSAIAIQIPIVSLLKAGAPAEPTSILDSDYVIGVWASASRPSMTTLSADADPSVSGDWIQVSRIGMPLTNEAVIPIGAKDFWNAISPYDEISETTLDKYFFNPELGLYMDDDLFGGAVPALGPLRIQTNSLGAFDFSNGADGLWSLKGSDAVAGTALDDAVFGSLLLPGPGLPRSVDLWPAFHTGVPNVIPYQLATGKEGNPLAAGKPFVNNFLPNGGDMLRLNMAVPPTPRDDANFSSLGLIQAAAIGLTVAPFNTNSDLEFLPNMDGFPNGRRLEDDVTRIELQAVSGVVLAAVGLWYDDFDPNTSTSPVTQDLLDVLTYTTGVETNDRPFSGSFPYLAMPASGTGECSGRLVQDEATAPPAQNVVGSIYVSSNTQNQIAVLDIDESNAISSSTFRTLANDGDGIYFDLNNGLLYQLNRDNGAVYVFEEVEEGDYQVAGLSGAESINGREITVSGDRLVIAQDADDRNGQQNRFIVLTRSEDGTSFRLASRYNTDINLWGIQAVGETMYAIEDNSNRLAIFRNFFAARSGSISPSRSVEVDGLVRTHGLQYIPSQDLMLMTDIGSAGSADDGAIVIIQNFTSASSDNVIAMSEQVRIEGSNTFLGNPVDVSFNTDNQMIYVAERANGGGRILAFPLNSTGGNMSPTFNLEFAGASAIHVPSDEDGVLTQELMTVAQVFVSSNTDQQIGVYNIVEDNGVSRQTFNNFAGDADGIYYRSETDMLYQVNRMNNSIAEFSNVNDALMTGQNPMLTALSPAEFTNGRELAFSGNRLVVAQDANDANGQTNSFVLFNIMDSGIRFDRELVADVNLWGIHADGETMYAIVDNSNLLVEYDDFFSSQGPTISADRTITIEGIVRTHGITYDAVADIMFLTDVGDAGSAVDGAFTVIQNYQAASADGVVSLNEQVRIEGEQSLLGNPVDIAWDPGTRMIYIAERANNGGRVLGFISPTSSGDLSPSYDDLFPGASAVFLSPTGTGMGFNRETVSKMVMDVEVIESSTQVQRTGVNQLEVASYRLTPNPAHDYINIDINGVKDLSTPTKIDVFTNAGKLLISRTTNELSSSFEIGDLAPGLYYIRTQRSSNTEILKFIKQ